MSFRYPKNGLPPDTPFFDGHMVEVELEGDTYWHWGVRHPPTCGEPDPMGYRPHCSLTNLLDNGPDMFGDVVEMIDGARWPKVLPHVSGWEAPLGYMVCVYSNYWVGDEVDVWLVVAATGDTP